MIEFEPDVRSIQIEYLCSFNGLNKTYKLSQLHSAFFHQPIRRHEWTLESKTIKTKEKYLENSLFIFTAFELKWNEMTCAFSRFGTIGYFNPFPTYPPQPVEVSFSCFYVSWITWHCHLSIGMPFVRLCVSDVNFRQIFAVQVWVIRMDGTTFNYRLVFGSSVHSIN